MRLEGDAWTQRFVAFEREAFRMELLPQYLVPQEAKEFAAFKAGLELPADLGAGWHLKIKLAQSRGARVRRVHVVTQPLSDYLRFECEHYYPGNVAAGEEIRILDLGAGGDVPLAPVDYWMFDEREVVHMLYEDDGTQIGRELLDDPDLRAYTAWRDAAWAAAVPFGEFWDARA